MVHKLTKYIIFSLKILFQNSRTRRWDLIRCINVDAFAVTLTFDLHNLTRSSTGASEYSLPVLSKLFKPFMRCHGNNIWPDKQTNEQTFQQDKNKCLRRQCWVADFIGKHKTKLHEVYSYFINFIQNMRQSWSDMSDWLCKQMPFLLANQQCESDKGNSLLTRT